MNPDVKQVFSQVKPLCDAIMINPTAKVIVKLQEAICIIRKETIQEMQLYILFPVITHLKAEELKHKYELQRALVNIMKTVIDRSIVSSTEMFVKYHNCLMSLVFDKTQPGMVAQGPEELKISVTDCLAAIILNMEDGVRLKVFQNYTPLLAQTIFVAVHLAKQEKLRSLRLSSIKCVRVYTATHSQFTVNHQVKPEVLEKAAIELVTNILPGVVAALQDVAVDVSNPGHSVIVAAVRAIHCIICLVMNDKYLPQKSVITTEDFAKIIQAKTKPAEDSDINNKEKSLKDLKKRSTDWFTMAGEKLKVVTESLTSLRTHDHMKVRKELGIFCTRILLECSRTMQPSMSLILDVVISLSKDEYEEVSEYCTQKMRLYFINMPEETRYKMLDSLSDNFHIILVTLPRILNNIDSFRKLSALNLLHGYLLLMCNEERPQRLTNVLTVHSTLLTMCNTLVEAVRVETDISLLALTTARHIESESSNKTPWYKLKHIEDAKSECCLIDICHVLGNAECAEIIVDQLLDMFQEFVRDRKEIVYLLNHIASAPSSSLCLVKRVLNMYIDPDVWYIPLEVSYKEPPITDSETLDVSVYNPRAWDKDYVPGLFEGAVATRYRDISYQVPRIDRVTDPNYCSTLLQAENNMVLSCTLTQGVGMLAERLMEDFQPFLLKTLCLILERAGSKFSQLREAGAYALRAAARSGSVCARELLRLNADYVAFQLSTRLKRSWNSQSALEMLTVVMEYSDVTIFDYLYGIVSDVLVQSCDKYHEKELMAYLQVFLKFFTCIQKWFPNEKNGEKTKQDEIVNNSSDEDIFQETLDYINNVVESERLLNEDEFEKDVGRSTEEMYREDLSKKEEDLLDYDDRVTDEKVPLPQYVTMTSIILKRCLNFVPSKRRPEKLLTLQILAEGLKILRPFENELLPVVHLIWSPLVVRFSEVNEPIVLREAFELLVTMADVSKEFISSRIVKEVFPNLYKFLHNSSKDSHLKDSGSAYRQSHAYRLQISTLSALPTLAVDLKLDDNDLEELMDCVQLYLSNKQPKPLQELAVNFFKTIFEYDEGAVWWHLRKLCNNQSQLLPPDNLTNLEPIIGTPYECDDKTYCSNIQMIFA